MSTPPMPDLLSTLGGPALVGAASAIVVQALNAWSSRRKLQSDEATALRQELRAELHDLRAEVERLQSELDQWKCKYYELRDANSAMQGELATLRAENADLRSELASLTTTVRNGNGRPPAVPA